MATVNAAPVVRPAPTGAITEQRRAAAPDRRFGLLILVVFVVYLATATWSPPINVDSFTNMLQARAFAADGSPVVADAEHLVDDELFGRVVLLVDSEHGPVAQYPPGVGLWGALFYLIDPALTHVPAAEYTMADGGTGYVALDVPAFPPAAMAAVVSATLAMLFFGLTLRRFLSEGVVLASVAVAAFGTGAWSVASDQLWQHSPGIMMIALGVYAASADRFALSGAAFAGAALIRPHTAIIAAGIGCTVALRRRQWAPMLRMGSMSALGIAGVVVYNRLVWGAISISGGYGSRFGERARTLSPLRLAGRFVEALVDPGHGVLVSSPFLIVALLALATRRTRRGPDWAVGAALGALVYLVVQFQANRVSGGNHIFGYRYPLEPMMAAAPLLAASTAAALRGRKSRFVFAALVLVSVASHAYGAAFVTA